MIERKALVVGATGLVGRELVRILATSNAYQIVEVWTRKKNETWPSGVQEKVVDFNQLSQLAYDADHIFCCLGSTIKKAGSKKNFKQIDYLYPLQIAQNSKAAGAKLFAVVTAMGSDSSSYFFYNKVKGNLEDDLSKIGLEHLGIFRPSLLLGNRKESRLGENIGKFLMHFFDALIPKKYKAIDAKAVAMAMNKYAHNSVKGKKIIENNEML